MGIENRMVWIEEKMKGVLAGPSAAGDAAGEFVGMKV
jgi:hypothetical protein